MCRSACGHSSNDGLCHCDLQWQRRCSATKLGERRDRHQSVSKFFFSPFQFGLSSQSKQPQHSLFICLPLLLQVAMCLHTRLRREGTRRVPKLIFPPLLVLLAFLSLL